LSRTMHHVAWKHWNLKRPTVYVYAMYSPYNGLEDGDETVGHELYDLRFYAGCRRTPQLVHLVRRYTGYSDTWGHAGGVAKGYGRKHRRRTRNEERTYGRDVLKAHRAGEDADDYLEPEGRTRRSAIWEAL